MHAEHRDGEACWTDQLPQQDTTEEEQKGVGAKVDKRLNMKAIFPFIRLLAVSMKIL